MPKERNHFAGEQLFQMTKVTKMILSSDFFFKFIRIGLPAFLRIFHEPGSQTVLKWVFLRHIHRISYLVQKLVHATN